MLLYILTYAIVIYICYFIYFRLRFRFWSTQPVFHFHNLWYWLFPPGIIYHTPFKRNKYYTPYNVNVDTFNSLSSLHLEKCIDVIQQNYLQEKEILYNPTRSNIMSYFEGHNNPCFMSYYFKNKVLTDVKTKRLIPQKDIIACLTARPLEITLYSKENFNAYYVDYLCVKKGERKQGLAPRVIYTYAIESRIANPDISVFMFKREGESTAIVPIVVYNSFMYDLKFWNSNTRFPAPYKLTRVNDGNFNLLVNKFQQIRAKFACTITSNISNIEVLVKNEWIIPYIIHDAHDIVAIYFFRNGCVTYEGGKVIELIASVLFQDEFTEFFELGVYMAIDELKKKHYKYFTAENMAHNGVLINNINNKKTPMYSVPYSYYFYNFAVRPFIQQDVFILC